MYGCNSMNVRMWLRLTVRAASATRLQWPQLRTFGAPQSFALQPVHRATDNPPGCKGLVIPASDLLGLIDGDASRLGCRFPHLGVGD